MFRLRWADATYGISPADWVLRIVAPTTNGHMNGDSEAGVERVREALTTGTIHGSFLEPGPAAKDA